MVTTLLSSVPSPAAVYLVQQVVRLRQLVARSPLLKMKPPGPCQLCGGEELALRMEPCGCIVCEQARVIASSLPPPVPTPTFVTPLAYYLIMLSAVPVARACQPPNRVG